MPGYQRTLTRKFGATAAVGAADGSSPSNAYTIGSHWTYLAANPSLMANSWLFLADGTYTGGTGSMVNPTGTIKGKAGGYVNVKASNDGKVVIDGQVTYDPILLAVGNDYFCIDGIDGCNVVNSDSHSICFVGSNYNYIRRCVLYDAPENYNTHVISLSGTTPFDTVNCIGNLFEDVACFGLGRKMFDHFQTAGPTTFRRFYGRWECSINTGPKRVIQDNYHSSNLTVDNAILRVDSHAMSYLYPTYILQNNGIPAAYPGVTSCTGGQPGVPAGECTYPGAPGSFVNENDGWCGEEEYSVGTDGANVDGHSRLRGILGMSVAADQYDCYNGPAHAIRGIFNHLTFGDTVIQDAFAYIEGLDYQGGVNPVGFFLTATSDDGGGHTAAQCALTNATSVCKGFAADSASAKWTVTNKVGGATLAAAGLVIDTGQGGAPETLYRGTSGAKLRYRYLNGTLTNIPLWPWPMAGRIVAAQARASSDGHGHGAIDYIDTMRKNVFGKSPDET